MRKEMEYKGSLAIITHGYIKKQEMDIHRTFYDDIQNKENCIELKYDTVWPLKQRLVPAGKVFLGRCCDLLKADADGLRCTLIMQGPNLCGKMHECLTMLEEKIGLEEDNHSDISEPAWIYGSLESAHQWAKQPLSDYERSARETVLGGELDIRLEMLK